MRGLVGSIVCVVTLCLAVVVSAEEILGVDFKITKDEVFLLEKRSIDVELLAPVSDQRLAEIAVEIKGMDRRPFKRTFITYRLKDEPPGYPAWATTHYNPDLKVINMSAFRSGD